MTQPRRWRLFQRVSLLHFCCFAALSVRANRGPDIRSLQSWNEAKAGSCRSFCQHYGSSTPLPLLAASDAIALLLLCACIRRWTIPQRYNGVIAGCHIPVLMRVWPHDGSDHLHAMACSEAALHPYLSNHRDVEHGHNDGPAF